MIIDYRTAGEAPQMGRNLFVKADTYLSTWAGTMSAPFTGFTESGYSSAFDFTGTSGYEVKYLEMDLIDGQSYTFSFDFTTPAYNQASAGNGIRLELRKDISDATNVNSANVIQTKSLPYVAGTTRQTFTFTAPSSRVWICINFGYVVDSIKYRFTFANFKMEFGSTATAWTAAPEDSPNLVRNSSMLKDTSYWITAGTGLWSRDANVTFNGYPTIKVKTTSNGYDGLQSSGYTIPFQNSTAYTYSFWIYRDSASPDGDLGKQIRIYFPEYNGGTVYNYHVISIDSTSLPDKTWKQFSMTFTTAASGTSTSIGPFKIDYLNVAGTACVWMADIKVEKNTVATAWTPAPEDVLAGLDRIPLAIGQRTIVDWNDTLQIQAIISANQGLTQKYLPSTEVYTPDWKTTNMVFTASLYKANTLGNIIDDGNVKSIRWFRNAPGYGEVELVAPGDSSWGINGKTLTRKDNLRPEVPVMGIRVEITYTDPISAKDILVRATMEIHLSVDAGGLTQAVMTMNGSPKLKNGNPEFVQSDSDRYGRNLFLNSRYFTNTNNWMLNKGADIAGALTIVNDATYGNVLKFTYDSGTSWWVAQNNYYNYWKNKFTVGATYTTTIMVKSTLAVTMTYADGSGQNNVSGTNYSIPSTAGVWTEYKWTATATATGNAPVLYLSKSQSAAGEIQIAYVKLEEGSTSTGWSIAPEERPSLSESTGQDKWLWRRYNVPTNFPSRAPLYSDINGLLMNDEMIVADQANIYYNTKNSSLDYYIGYLATSVYVSQAKTLPISYHADDSVSVYLNNARVDYSADGVLASDRTAVMNLTPGWNTLEFLYFEKTGNDGIWNFATTQVQLIRDATNLSTYVETPGNYLGVKQGDGLYRFNLKSDMATIEAPLMVNVLQGSNYTMSFVFRTDSTDLSFAMEFSDGTNTIFAPMSVDLGVVHSAAINGDFSPIAIDMGNGLKKVYATFTANNTMVKPFTLKYFSYTTGTYMDIGQPKLELGSTPTDFSLAPADVAPSILKTHVEKVNSFYIAPFEKYLTNLTLTCQLYKASVIDTTNVTYQWYKKDDTITTSQGGGVGWLKLTASSTETGYNLSTLIVPGSAVDEHEVYKCIITDTDQQSSTYNKSFESTATVVDIASPITIEVVSSTGYTIHNGQGGTTLTAKVWREGLELDMTGTQYTYTWYRYNKDGVKDTAWNSNTGFKTGKTLDVSNTDILEKATFSVEVVS